MFFQAPFALDTTFGLFPVDAQNIILLLVKLLLIVGSLLYLIFAFVVVRQVQVMRSTVLTPLSNVVQILGLVHLLFAVGVLLFFILVL